MKANLERRIAVLEAKAKSPMIATWVNFILWLDEHEDDAGDLAVALRPELQELVVMAATKIRGLE